MRVIEGGELGGLLLSREFLNVGRCMGGSDVVGVSDGGPHATLEGGAGCSRSRCSLVWRVRVLHSLQGVEWIQVKVNLAGLVGRVAQLLLPAGLLHGHHQVRGLLS